MNGVVEALHIYDEHNALILSHTYTSRPLAANHLLPLYLEHPVPRPNLIYLPSTNPPTLVFSLRHANLLFLLTTSSEIEPLLVLEFLHRAVDALEEFLGAPLLAHKIEANYDVVAQLLTEMCDAGTISTTEPNALRDLVEVEGFMDKLLGNLNLPTKPSFATGPTPALHVQPNTPALPWRRANVRHTSNKLYCDMIETLSVTLAPSGRPLAAFANGTIAFTSEVSGVPDIVMTLTGPAGKHNLGSVIDLPVFHPCVRLARWREQPGVLSFIPPDGRFTLAGYEVDLMPLTGEGVAAYGPGANPLRLPVSLEIKTGLGPTGSEFEVRVQVNRVFGPAGGGQGSRGGGAGVGSSGGGGGVGARGFGVGSLQPGTPGRLCCKISSSRSPYRRTPGDRALEWSISNKELSQGTSSFALRCTVVGQTPDEDDEDSDPTGFGFGSGASAYSYDEPYQASSPVTKAADASPTTGAGERDERKAAQNKILMPSSASVSFTVKGWLASGIKVESINLDSKKSRGLGESVKPYKGVKYLTVSRGGVEIRC
ncbi:hypothetical protein VTH06DRAFT_7352 [Thermothelomyces fergusii]